MLNTDVIGAVLFFGFGFIGIIVAMIINRRLIARSHEVLDRWACELGYAVVRRKAPLVLRGALAKYARSDAVYDVTLRTSDGVERRARVVIPYKPTPGQALLRVERWDD